MKQRYRNQIYLISLMLMLVLTGCGTTASYKAEVTTFAEGVEAAKDGYIGERDRFEAKRKKDVYDKRADLFEDSPPRAVIRPAKSNRVRYCGAIGI